MFEGIVIYHTENGTDGCYSTDGVVYSWEFEYQEHDGLYFWSTSRNN